LHEAGSFHRVAAVCGQEGVEIDRVERQPPTELEVGKAPLEHELPEMAHGDAEVASGGEDVEAATIVLTRGHSGAWSRLIDRRDNGRAAACLPASTDAASPTVSAERRRHPMAVYGTWRSSVSR
jgi:hypothetical protein